jgi:exoribonuclease R
VPRRVVRVRRGGDDAALRRGLATLHDELGIVDEFPPAVLAEAEDAVTSPALPELDRTDLPLVTIDPESARDLDQALHLERRGNGYRVHYAIADVAAFVRPGGAVDEEAHRRGETLYGLDSKVPLHPPRISEEACSLLPDGPRPAILWSIDLDPAGERTAVRVERAVVRSRAKLSYAGVQAELDAGTAGPALGLLREVGELRLARERDRGGVSLPLPDQEVTRVDGRWELAYRDLLPVEAWNAQISLLTGMAAAGLMLDGGTGVLRTVPPADRRDVERLRRVAAALGVAWPAGEPYPELIRRLDAARADHAALLNEATSLLRGSAYAAFDGSAPTQPTHSAIASTYAHVTAPLRRLVDRYALECCVATCAGRPVPDWVAERLPELPATMQASGRRASGYERGVLDLVEAVLLRDDVGRRFRGSVVDVDEKHPDRGRVVITAPAVEARVRSSSGGPLPLGTDVEVVLVSAEPQERRVLFELP